MTAEGWLSFPLFILHPCMDLSPSDAGRKRVSSPSPVLLHEVAARLFYYAELFNAEIFIAILNDRYFALFSKVNT
jgi:hypothetical protein